MFVRWRSKDLIARSQKAPSPSVVEPAALFGAAEVAGVDVFAMIREEPGNVSVKTIEREAFKLNAIRKVGLPDVLFADVAPKVLASLRARGAAPSHLRSHPHEIKMTLLAAYLFWRAERSPMRWLTCSSPRCTGSTRAPRRRSLVTSWPS